MEQQQIQLFIIGLGKVLRIYVTLKKPTTLDEAAMFARAYEQRITTPAAPTPASIRPPGCSFRRSFATSSAPPSNEWVDRIIQ
jgi:hypothetical protein